MSPAKISKKIIADKTDWIEDMIEEIESLPLNSFQDFCSDKRNIWSAESCLRRAIEALMDIGRHIVAKGFGKGVSEYKKIGAYLCHTGVINESEKECFRVLAGYRNRMVHFYSEISDKELFEICSS